MSAQNAEEAKTNHEYTKSRKITVTEYIFFWRLALESKIQYGARINTREEIPCIKIETSIINEIKLKQQSAVTWPDILYKSEYHIQRNIVFSNGLNTSDKRSKQSPLDHNFQKPPKNRSMWRLWLKQIRMELKVRSNN